VVAQGGVRDADRLADGPQRRAHTVPREQVEGAEQDLRAALRPLAVRAAVRHAVMVPPGGRARPPRTRRARRAPTPATYAAAPRTAPRRRPAAGRGRRARAAARRRRPAAGPRASPAGR